MKEEIKKRIEKMYKRKLTYAEIEYIKEWELKTAEKYANGRPFSKYLICLLAFEIEKSHRHHNKKQNERGRHRCPECNIALLPGGREPWRVWWCHTCKRNYICFENSKCRIYLNFEKFERGAICSYE